MQGCFTIASPPAAACCWRVAPLVEPAPACGEPPPGLAAPAAGFALWPQPWLSVEPTQVPPVNKAWDAL